nr:type II toxin-antitoxin system prevent-host-death family antitoxin [Granulicella sp. dw_53]
MVDHDYMIVSVASARNRLTELLRLAEAGEEIIIERHGRAVAQLRQLPPELRPAKEDTFDVAMNEIANPAFLRKILRS